MFKLALVQMLVEGGAPEANLRRALDRIDDAAANGAQMVVLPEAMNLGWTHSSILNNADVIPDGPTCKGLMESARKHGIHLCAGIIEKDKDRSYNAAILIDPQGKLLLRHRKINELEIAHPYYSLGEKLEVVPTALGNIGVMICADAFAPGCVLTRSLCYMGADIIVSPCAWAVVADHDNNAEPYGQLWRDSYKPVAREFSVWIAGVSNVGWISKGPWAGRKCIGCSLVVDACGNEAAAGPYGHDAEAIMYVDVNIVPRPAGGAGWSRIGTSA